MYGIKVTKPRCGTCDRLKIYSGALPMKTHGVMLHVGDKYCDCGKKYRKFKKSELKKSIQEWCPRRKNPPELKVYCFKDDDAEDLHGLLFLMGDRMQDSPIAHRYALRFKGHSPVCAYDLGKCLEADANIPDLGTPVDLFEVVEIDDGLKPYFFYKTPHGLELTLFDRETAMKNKLKRIMPSDSAQQGAVHEE